MSIARIIKAAAAALACSAAGHMPAHAQAYPQLTILVGSPTGGSYDLYARVIARHMGRHLPGLPNVVVQNLPGGGGYAAVNQLANTAPKDGSVIATFSRAVPMQPLIDKTGVHFDPQQLLWIGSPSDEVGLALSWHKSPVKTFDDLQKTGMTVASTGPGTDTNVFARVVANVLGIKLKLVSGYRGAADMLLAVERGEVDGAVGISWASLWPHKKDWVENNQVNFLIQLTLQDGHERLRGVPRIIDVVSKQEDRDLLDVIFARQTMAYPYAAAPGIPPERLAALRKAFAATLTDSEFLAETMKSGMSIKPVSAEQMTTIVKRVYSSAPAMIERVKTAMSATNE